MSLRVEFLSDSEVDLQDGFSRYEDLCEGVGVEFMVAVDSYLTRIANFPEIAPLYCDAVRRQVMQKFL